MPYLRDNYNIFAGLKIQRMKALSDGVFSIAMTLLVLELSIPFLVNVHTEGDLWLILLSTAPKLLVYFMSFITLGIFWTANPYNSLISPKVTGTLTGSLFSF